jgi:hypothetical protein
MGKQIFELIHNLWTEKSAKITKRSVKITKNSIKTTKITVKILEQSVFETDSQV